MRRDVKWTKPPVNPRTGRRAKVNDPSTWGTFDEALALLHRRPDLAGLGIVMVGDDDLAGADLDDCITDSDAHTPIAAEVLGYSETYAEISPSGEGVRLFIKGKAPQVVKVDAVGVELYNEGRYLTVTGRHVEGTPAEVRPAPRTIARLEAERPAQPNAPKPNGHAKSATGDFFTNVNAAALGHLDKWVPALHPSAKKQATGAWRVTSKDLGRNLEEDLAYHHDGIRDHGDELGHTPINAVLKYGTPANPTEAGHWLCERIGIEPAALGFTATSSRASSSADRGIRAWPIMESEAMPGIVGRIARLATENSEADPVAVVATTLVYAAAEFGRAQFTRIGDDTHHSCHFNTIVGRSSRARKGTSWGPVQRIFKRAEEIRLNESTLPFPIGCRLKVSGGPLSSGEGLVYAIRDGNDDEEDGDPGASDKGVPDKRLLVVEQELGAALRLPATR